MRSEDEIREKLLRVKDHQNKYCTDENTLAYIIQDTIIMTLEWVLQEDNQ